MSYSIRLQKIDGKLVADEYVESQGAHLPDGAVIVVNGHHPFEGTSSMGTIGVSLSIKPKDERSYAEQIVSSTAAYNAKSSV